MFYLKKENSPQHGGVRIMFMTHPNRCLTVDEARQLAKELLDLTDSQPGTGVAVVQPPVKAPAATETEV